MGINQTKNRRKCPSVAEEAISAVNPLYPNLTNEFPTYGHSNMADFRGTQTPEACFSNTITFHNMQGPGPSSAGVNLLHPNLTNQFYNYAQPNTPNPDAYFGNMMPNFHNVHSTNCHPAPSAPPAPSEGELMRAQITAIVQSVMRQEVEMQTRQPEEHPQNQKTRSRNNRKKNKSSQHNNYPEKKPCPNAGEGCKLLFKPEHMQLHVKECLFTDYTCPLNGIFAPCAWQGKVKNIRDHFEGKHPTNIGHVTKLMFLGSSRIIHLVELGAHIFLAHIKVDVIKRNIFVGVQLYSTQICASRWTYEFEFRGPMMPNMRLQNTCIAAGVAIDKFDKPQCGVLNMTPCVFNAFKNEALKFQYRIMIDKGNN